MGTTVEVTVYRSSTEAHSAADDLDAAFTVITGVDDRMSLYKAGSELVGLNAQAGSGSVNVSAPLFEILDASHFYANLSNGAFDATLQPLVALWGFYDVREAAVPSQSEIDTVLRVVGTDHMRLDNAAATVALDAGAAIDLGGIAKGYAIDLALEALSARGVTAALVNLGGNVGVIGSPPGDRPWVVGLKHPRDEGLIGRLEFTTGAVSTSGDYDRYFEAEGVRYSHLLDPRTGWPVDALAALTVHAPTATAADALSTAAFVLGPEDGIALLEQCAEVTAVAVSSDADETKNVEALRTSSGTRTQLMLGPRFGAVQETRKSNKDDIDCTFKRGGAQKK